MSQQSAHDPNASARQLPWLARLFLGLIFAAGVASCTYGGIILGLIVGIEKGAEGLDQPRPGIGLAPDLTGVVELFFNTGMGGIVGAALGLLLGLLLMWALNRWVFAPLLGRMTGSAP